MRYIHFNTWKRVKHAGSFGDFWGVCSNKTLIYHHFTLWPKMLDLTRVVAAITWGLGEIRWFLENFSIDRPSGPNFHEAWHSCSEYMWILYNIVIGLRRQDWVDFFCPYVSSRQLLDMCRIQTVALFSSSISSSCFVVPRRFESIAWRGLTSAGPTVKFEANVTLVILG